MAKTSKKPQYTSKGERPSTSASTLNAVRKEGGTSLKLLNQQDAWLKGQNPWLNVENPNPNETNKKRIRVRANNYWGNPNAKKYDETKPKFAEQL